MALAYVQLSPAAARLNLTGTISNGAYGANLIRGWVAYRNGVLIPDIASVTSTDVQFASPDVAAALEAAAAPPPPPAPIVSPTIAPASPPPSGPAAAPSMPATMAGITSAPGSSARALSLPNLNLPRFARPRAAALASAPAAPAISPLVWLALAVGAALWWMRK